jgi:TetR/AcrR family transcriptional regulator, transcriptional repressor for nem operon
MSRVSRQQAANNRIAITEASARLFRERGIKGVSVSDLMGAAGLTHGGFYGHFTSKDALAAEACSWAFDRSCERWKKRIADNADSHAAKAALIDGYLSPAARGSPGTSCPTTALASDVAREELDSPVRAAFACGVEALMSIFGELQHAGNSGADRREALAEFSTMVGALLLARATAGHKISDELLNAARERLNVPGRRKTARKPTRHLKPR